MMRFLVLYDTPAHPEAFDQHYRDVHIPLAKALPGLRRYTLGRPAAAVRGEGPYYLVAELDFDSSEALRAAFDSPEGRAAAADVANLAPNGGVRSMIFPVEDVV
jgi:uncharacterized protein (TIGR02118 family)